MGLGYFIAGMYEKLKNVVIVHKMLFDLFEVIVVSFALLTMFVRPLFFGILVIYISFMVLILLFALNKGIVSNFFNKPIFSKLSCYCLSIFLTHWFLVANIFPVLFQRYNQFFCVHQIITVISVLCLCCFVGIISHHAIELPATKFLRNILKH